ncbi:hypothetical protein [Qaidamihabitans albus]|uniref:hypothetical protein n=1 Tax=Qaidamihabitans albus TaxID=2795733 RepID=UPI0018F12C7F
MSCPQRWAGRRRPATLTVRVSFFEFKGRHETGPAPACGTGPARRRGFPGNYLAARSSPSMSSRSRLRSTVMPSSLNVRSGLT